MYYDLYYHYNVKENFQYSKNVFPKKYFFHVYVYFFSFLVTIVTFPSFLMF